jgi:phosphoribosylformylglycinamidine (FGAM) synthase-like amidotransferase family enzyme
MIRPVSPDRGCGEKIGISANRKTLVGDAFAKTLPMAKRVLGVCNGYKRVVLTVV